MKKQEIRFLLFQDDALLINAHPDALHRLVKEFQALEEAYPHSTIKVVRRIVTTDDNDVTARFRVLN